MGWLKEFKEFAMRGNVVDMAVGIIIGAEFGKIVNSLVNDIIMPPIGYLIGGMDFTALTFKLNVPAVTGPDGGILKEASEVDIKWGAFAQTALNFLIIAFAIFLVIKLMNSMKKRFEKEKASDPAAVPADIQLLTEIRDALKAR
ncbi:MAG TPA: large-conductance mechanosensitive channel protein MscL [Pirellulaceae bacterium]|nr:large-conductance mechanosensitive channel protein MscL [Pirellulaceae bacterium]HMO93384.1 large-conductance mechanosensitive channel protein MscL [Pirellulaceae bacterium]HMP70444.1 large-conductance mechanosensitive channel protein MscL [Pirellulaceae bacterium]